MTGPHQEPIRTRSARRLRLAVLLVVPPAVAAGVARRRRGGGR